MTSRLLPHKDLIALLCRRCYGESIDSLAAAYLLKRDQVINLLGTNRKAVLQMFQFLTIIPKTIRADGAWRKCYQCKEMVFTHSNRGFHKCDWCKTALRGAG